MWACAFLIQSKNFFCQCYVFPSIFEIWWSLFSIKFIQFEVTSCFIRFKKDTEPILFGNRQQKSLSLRNMNIHSGTIKTNPLWMYSVSNFDKVELMNKRNGKTAAKAHQRQPANTMKRFLLMSLFFVPVKMKWTHFEQENIFNSVTLLSKLN